MGQIRFNDALSRLADAVLAGRCSEMPWEIFRARHLPGRSHEEAIAQSAFWARHHGIRLRFVQREIDGAIMSTPIIMLLLEPLGP